MRIRNVHSCLSAVPLACSLVALLALGCATSCGYSYETGGGKPANAVGSSASSNVLAPPAAVDAPDADAPVMVASGWWAKDSYVHYGVKVENPNEDYVAHGIEVHVVLKDESDQVAYESTDVIPEIGPGETIGFTGTSGDGWAPADVEITLVDGSATWSDGSGYIDPFTVEDVVERDMGEFRYELTGQVTNNTESYVSTVDLHALLIGEDGKIMAGYAAESYKLKPGQTKNFTHTINSAPDHASVEVYAQPRY